MSLAKQWKLRVLGPDEIVHARKSRGSKVKVCEVNAFYYDGFVERTIKATARHWFGEDINTITCRVCRARLDLDRPKPKPKERTERMVRAVRVFTSAEAVVEAYENKEAADEYVETLGTFFEEEEDEDEKRQRDEDDQYHLIDDESFAPINEPRCSRCEKFYSLCDCEEFGQ